MPPRQDMSIDARDSDVLARWLRARTLPLRTVLRTRIVVMLGQGLSAREVARQLGISRHTVDLWRQRYLQEGCVALTHDKPGRGRHRSSVAAPSDAKA